MRRSLSRFTCWFLSAQTSSNVTPRWLNVFRWWQSKTVKCSVYIPETFWKLLRSSILFCVLIRSLNNNKRICFANKTSFRLTIKSYQTENSQWMIKHVTGGVQKHFKNCVVCLNRFPSIYLNNGRRPQKKEKLERLVLKSVVKIVNVTDFVHA